MYDVEDAVRAFKGKKQSLLERKKKLLQEVRTLSRELNDQQQDFSTLQQNITDESFNRQKMEILELEQILKEQDLIISQKEERNRKHQERWNLEENFWQSWQNEVRSKLDPMEKQVKQEIQTARNNAENLKPKLIRDYMKVKSDISTTESDISYETERLVELKKLDEIQLWKIYHQLCEDQSSNPLNVLHFPITSPALMSSSLSTLAKKLKLSLPQDYFSIDVNPNFKKDKLDINNIDFSSFQMRICNYLLELIHSQGSYSESLHEFLFESFKTREQAKGQPVDSDSEGQSSLESKEDKLFLSSLVDQVVDEIRKEKPTKENVLKKKIQEKKPQEKKYKEFEHKWTDDFLETFQEDLQKVFEKHLKKGQLLKKDIKNLAQIILKKFNLFVDDSQLNDLLNMTEAFLFLGKTSVVFSFEKFQQVLKMWGKNFNNNKKTFKGKLKTTLKKLDELNLEFQDISSLSKTLTELKASLEHILTQVRPDPPEVNPKIKKNLEEIFQFYAKGQKIQGIEKTFDGLEASNSTWNLGKFFRFFQDFELIPMKNESNKGVSRSQLASVFQKYSKNSRIMDFESFIQSLFFIAEQFGSVLLHEDLSARSSSEKFELFLTSLSLNESNSYQQKLKGFNKPPSPESHNRIPKYKLRRVSNDYQLPDSFIKQVEDWKNKKFKVHNSTPTQIKKGDFLKHHENLRRLRKSSLDGYSIGYSGKNKKKNLRESLSPRIQDLKSSEESLEKFFEREEKQNVRIITFKDLNQMKYQDFNDQDFLDLIQEDETDEYFDNVYKIEPRLQGIFKMHQEKVDKGLKVIEKAKPSLSNKKIFK